MDVALAEILSISAVNNARAGITGGLVCCKGWFVQLLEGDPLAIADLYYKIKRDSPHESVTLIGTLGVNQIAFTNWSMCGARFSLADDAIIKVLGRQSAFSPPEMNFEIARDIIGVVDLPLIFSSTRS